MTSNAGACLDKLLTSCLGQMEKKGIELKIDCFRSLIVHEQWVDVILRRITFTLSCNMADRPKQPEKFQQIQE